MEEHTEKRPADRLAEWVAAIKQYEPTPWERLPELELYMDQVLTLMEKQLLPGVSDGDRLLTSSMINNYVKDGVVPRPMHKRYNREHVGQLYMVCMLKSILPLPQIHELLQERTEEGGTERLYTAFSQAQTAAFQEMTQRMENLGDEPDAWYALAMDLALEASARYVVATHLLQLLAPDEPEKADKKK